MLIIKSYKGFLFHVILSFLFPLIISVIFSINKSFFFKSNDLFFLEIFLLLTCTIPMLFISIFFSLSLLSVLLMVIFSILFRLLIIYFFIYLHNKNKKVSVIFDVIFVFLNLVTGWFFLAVLWNA